MRGNGGSRPIGLPRWLANGPPQAREPVPDSQLHAAVCLALALEIHGTPEAVRNAAINLTSSDRLTPGHRKVMQKLADLDLVEIINSAVMLIAQSK